jgi:hypothetical protein
MPQLGSFEIGYAELGNPTGTAYTKTVAASMDVFAVDLTVPIEVMSRQTGKQVLGSTSTPTAAVTKRTTRIFVAAMQTAAGNITKSARKILSASSSVPAALLATGSALLLSLSASLSTLAASVSRRTAKGLTASSATASATQIKLTGKSITASAAQYSVSVTRSIARLMTQVLNLDGAIAKSTTRALTAVLNTFTGTVSTVRAFFATLTASVSTMSSALSRMTGRSIDAQTEQPTASITRLTSRALLASAAAMLGVCEKAISVSFSASLELWTAVLPFFSTVLTPAVRTLFVQFESRVVSVLAQARAWVQSAADSRLKVEERLEREITEDGSE